MILVRVRDIKTGKWSAPQPHDTEESALRGFEVGQQDPGSLLHTHPDDFALFIVASYDEHDPVIKPIDPPYALGTAAQFAANPPAMGSLSNPPQMNLYDEKEAERLREEQS